MQVRERIDRASDTLTAAERRLTSALLSDYPFAGLEPIQTLAARSKVSAPSITRFVHKLGFGGFQEFQRQLIDELKAGRRSPLDLHDEAAKGRPLAGFLAEVSGLVQAVGESVTEAQFARLCAMLGDERRAVHVIGGRVSDALAQHLSRHLRQIRPGVRHLSPDPERWPDDVLGMRPRDVLLAVDFRRYQPNLLALAERAAGRGAHVVLVTDRWLSPIARTAREVIAAPIESGTAWDSYVAAAALFEAMVARIAETDWARASARIETWETVRLDRMEDPIGQ